MSFDVNDSILIVTGSELVPEMKDRPLAYRLKEIIDPKGKTDYQKAVVVSDRWYLENELLQICATILLGGPGVNAASAQWYDKLPLYWTRNDQSFVQWQQDQESKIAIWGMNQASTEDAMTYFVEDLLEEYLQSVWNSY